MMLWGKPSAAPAALPAFPCWRCVDQEHLVDLTAIVTFGPPLSQHLARAAALAMESASP